jgi:hypothetical protein
MQPLHGPGQFPETISDPAQDIRIPHRLNRPFLLLTLCPAGRLAGIESRADAWAVLRITSGW